MTRKRLLLSLISSAPLLCLGLPAAAQAPAAAAPVTVEGAWVRPTVPGQKGTGAFMRITAKEGMKLVGAASPAAGVTEVHEMKMEGNVMRMRAIDGLTVPAKGEVRLRHGGEHHLMLIGLKAPLKDGDRFPMTLRFEKAGEREVMVWVQQPRDAAGAHEHKH